MVVNVNLQVLSLKKKAKLSNTFISPLPVQLQPLHPHPSRRPRLGPGSTERRLQLLWRLWRGAGGDQERERGLQRVHLDLERRQGQHRGRRHGDFPNYAQKYFFTKIAQILQVYYFLSLREIANFLFLFQTFVSTMVLALKPQAPEVNKHIC